MVETLEERQEIRSIQKAENNIDKSIEEAQRTIERVEDMEHIEDIDDIQKSIKELEVLADKTKKARKILDIGDREISKIDKENIFERIRKDVLDRYPNPKINIDVDIDTPIRVHTPLKPALGELIENGIKHNTSPYSRYKG